MTAASNEDRVIDNRATDRREVVRADGSVRASFSADLVCYVNRPNWPILRPAWGSLPGSFEDASK